MEGRYILKHKDHNVAILNFSESGNLLSSQILGKERLPLGCLNENGDVNKKRLEIWWNDRAIPRDRKNIHVIINLERGAARNKLMLNSKALSLSDHYWVTSNLNDKWNHINYYENVFDDRLSRIVNDEVTNIKFSMKTPEFTTGGNLIKRWRILENGERVLEKRGDYPLFQETINEVIGTKLCERLSIEHIKYELDFLKEENGFLMPFCRCKNITDIDNELISAIDVYNSIGVSVFNDDFYEHYIKCLENIGIKDGYKELDRMFVFDYIMFNHDRHFNNFGILRNSKKLNNYKIAPLFDNGTSLYCNTGDYAIKYPERLIKRSRGFMQIDKQLDLVKDWSWYDRKNLIGFGDEVMELLKSLESISKKRAELIRSVLNERLKDLERYIKNHKKRK